MVVKTTKASTKNKTGTVTVLKPKKQTPKKQPKPKLYVAVQTDNGGQQFIPVSNIKPVQVKKVKATPKAPKAPKEPKAKVAQAPKTPKAKATPKTPKPKAAPKTPKASKMKCEPA